MGTVTARRGDGGGDGGGDDGGGHKGRGVSKMGCPLLPPFRRDTEPRVRMTPIQRWRPVRLAFVGTQGHMFG